MKDADFLATLDYAILKPDAPLSALDEAATLCKNLGVGCLCVKSCDVAYAKKLLKGCKTQLAAVVGFPHGNTLPEIKAIETQRAVADGADEIDMVINIAALKAGNAKAVESEIRAVVTAAGEAPVKAILETAYLNDEQLRWGVQAAIAGGAAWVKTSTGFATHGATPEAVQIMLDETKGTSVQVKASGGIRTRKEGEQYLAMGCTRLGIGNVLALLN